MTEEETLTVLLDDARMKAENEAFTAKLSLGNVRSLALRMLDTPDGRPEAARFHAYAKLFLRFCETGGVGGEE